jgi:predicted amidophosphoribosyltransferase
VRERGFDHARLLAKQIANGLNAEYSPALTRLGQSQQVGAKRFQRLNQQAGNYRVRQPLIVRGRNVLLVDDVVTTGATLKAATKALRQAGAAHVDALIFAKAL